MFLFFCLVQTVQAQDSTTIVAQKYKISLEQKEILYDFDVDTLLVQIYSPQVPLKGFALKIAVQSQYFNIDAIIPGKFYDDCGWEFFNAKQIISDFSAENYLQVWQIIGLSEIMQDSISPTCYFSETKTSLAKIIISRNKFSQAVDSIIPIFFLWENCSDNTISGMSGNDLYVSKKVMQFDNNQPQFLKNQFPTTQGIPTNCVKAAALNAPLKWIEFLPGRIILQDRNSNDSLDEN